MQKVARVRQRPDLPPVVGTAGALGTLAWMAASASPEIVAQLFWVAAPVRIATSYVDLSTEVPMLRNAKGSLSALNMGAVAAQGSFPMLILGMAGAYTEGGNLRLAARRQPQLALPELSALPPEPVAFQPEPTVAQLEPPALYNDLGRCRQQLWWWSSAVAGLTFLITADIRRALAVMLAGSPSAMVTALAIATWREARHWEQRGLLLGHPLLLMTAADVNLVLFDLNSVPAPDTVAGLQRMIPQLRARQYRVGLLTGAAPDQLRNLARELDIDLWYVGEQEERARWVIEWRERGGHVAVVGCEPESLPVISAADLAVRLEPAAAVHRTAPRETAVRAVVPATPDLLPQFLAGSRQSARMARHVVTASRTLAVAATVATAAGVLAAMNVLTVANILGLGLITLNQLSKKRGPQRG